MNVNRVIVLGNLTRSPEIRQGQNGVTVATFGVATNRTWTDQAGEKQEEVEFHNAVAFGRQAEIAGEYLRKGQLVYLEGRLQTRAWEQDGRKFSRTQIVVERFQLGPKRDQEAIADYDDSDGSVETMPVQANGTTTPNAEVPF